MSQSVEGKIRSAINDRKIIEFDYGGRHRIAEPQVYGMCKGVPQLLVYQIGGETSAGSLLPQWRRMIASQITNLKVRRETFQGPRQSFSAHHSGFDEMLAAVGQPSEMPTQTRLTHFT